MRGLTALTIGLFAGLLLIGCRNDESAAEGAAVGEVEAIGSDYSFEVVLSNALADTLRGDATFGRMRDPHEGRDYFVIRLASRYDFAGGFVIARPKPELPEPGTFGIAAAADTIETAAEGDFILLFREGMLRDLRSRSGSLTISTVTDTLITGRFDAVLTGYISEGSRELPGSEVRATGRFRAESGVVGYFMGL